MTRVLFVNHRQQVCGVNSMGSRYYRNLSETKKYETYYIDVDHRAEFEFWFEELKPEAIIYNFYSGATMYWLSRECVDEKRLKCKQLGIFHELDLSGIGFDLILHQNPLSNDAFPHWSLPRSLPEWDRFYPDPALPTFGSFGFGIGGKGFDTLVRRVNTEYDEARIHLHIPFAHFGDADGAGALAHAADARRENVKVGIELTIDHEFWPEERLLDWLAHNTCNAFLYHPHHGRGISGTLDYSLAVRRPLAITHSYQFQHVTAIDDSCCIDSATPKTLHEIIAAGSAPTDRFRALWSREAFVASFEQALSSIGVEP